MKRKTICVFSLILFLLISCTLFSLRIEKMMIPQVTIRGLETSKSTLPIDCLFQDESGSHLFAIREGSGWENGIRVDEISSNRYAMAENEILINYVADFIQYASKPPLPGQEVSIQKGGEKLNDTWLAVFSEEPPKVETIPENMEILQAKNKSWLLSVKNAERPFMADRARSMIFPATSGTLPVRESEAAYYSLLDVKQFLGNLPLFALLLAILILPATLWVYSCYLAREPKRNRRLILINTGIAVFSLIVMPAVLHFIDLPSSLLPRNSIVDFGHYAFEFTQVLDTLKSYADANLQPVQIILESIAKLSYTFWGILCGSLVLVALILWGEIMVHHRSQQYKSKHGR